MSDIRILAAGKEQADIVAPYMGREALDALKASLPITVLAAVDKDGVMGVLAGAMDQDVFMIDSLFVDPEKRGIGAGRALIECLDGIFEEGDIAVRAEFNIENKDKVESEWGVVEKNTKPFFTQKLATAKKDKKWGSTENDAVKKAKSKFRNADVCTVTIITAEMIRRY